MGDDPKVEYPVKELIGEVRDELRGVRQDIQLITTKMTADFLALQGRVLNVEVRQQEDRDRIAVNERHKATQRTTVIAGVTTGVLGLVGAVLALFFK